MHASESVLAEIALNHNMHRFIYVVFLCGSRASMTYFSREMIAELFKISVNLQFDMIDYNT